ncbi:MAG: amidohydrolase family protein, partial [Trueperaceae bacterium]|nr:amidohydrolase family protein [Trueperaceae bacterium]
AMSFDEAGLATGEIVEGGVFIFGIDHLPKGEDFILRAHKRALKRMAAYGITSVHNMLGNAEQAHFYSKLERSGDLSCRVYMPYHVEPTTPFEALATEAVTLRQTYRSEIFRAGAVKFFADGVYDGKTALTLNGYPDDPNYLGESIFEPDHYKALVTEADRLGFQIATHAVGNGAVRLALNAYETAQKTNGKRDSRHRIEHIEVIDPSDIPRFKELGVIASMQTLHAPLNTQDADLWLKHVHEQEWSYAFAFRRLRDAGAHMALGSDWSVVSMDPFLSWYAAFNRHPWGSEGSRHYKQSLHEVIAGYTKDGAYTEFKEGTKGQLKVGYMADIVLLSEDVFGLEPGQLDKVQANLTMMDGKLVHSAL